MTEQRIEQENPVSTPLVSIALCTYNGEKYIEQQLDSIISQDYRNLEIVIVDDCSTDSTPRILEEYKSRDSRIKLSINSENIGFIKNFERALRCCQGAYIALSDQDDIWLPNKIDSLLDEIDQQLLIYSRVTLIDADSNPIDGKFPRVNQIEGACALSLILDNCVIGNTCFINRNLLERALPFPNTLFSHDQWLAIVAAAQGRLKASQKMLSYYRSHDQNTLLNRGQKKSPSKTRKNRQKLGRIMDLAKTVLDTGLLNERDQRLLKRLFSLMALSEHRFYNWQLASFLKTHIAEFMQLYNNPEKAIRKICRGIRYYKLIDLLSAAFSMKKRKLSKSSMKNNRET